MTTPTPPHAALDQVLAHTRHLLLDFDGVICDLTTRQPASATADQLRGVLQAHETTLPGHIGATTNPLAVLSYAATISAELAEQVDIELTNCELGAIPTARPTGYAHDTVTSAQESGRAVTIISTRSAEVVNAYLQRAELSRAVTRVAAPASYPPGHLQTYEDVIRDTLCDLNAAPDESALVTASPAGIEAARTAGAHPIGYATSSNDREHLANAGAACVIATLADLALRLRAKPS